MPARATLRVLTAAIAALSLVSVVDAQTERRPGQRTRGAVSMNQGTATGEPIDFSFEGGNAYEYVEALRAVSPNLNVVLEPDAALIEIEPIIMRNVDPETAIYLLDDMTRTLADHQMIQLDVDTILRHPGTAPLYQVFAQRQTSRTQTVPVSHVWSLRELVDGGTPAEHVLMAIEAALGLSDAHEPATLRFHPETHLLLVNAQPAQLETIDSIWNELIRAQQESGPGYRDVATMTAKLRELTTALELSQKQLVESQTMLRVFERQIDMIENRYRDAQELADAERRKRFEVELMCERLQQQLHGITEPE